MTLAEDLTQRHARLLDGLDADCLVAVRDESVTYLTGYTTMTWKMYSRPIVAILARDGRLIVVVAETEADSARQRIPGCDVRAYVEMDLVEPGGALPDGRLQFAPAAARAVAGVLEDIGAARVAVDGLHAAWPPVGQITALLDSAPALADASELVWTARLRKTPWELERMRAAATVLAAAYERLREQIAPGMTEREIATRFIVAQWECGAHEVGPLAVVADPSRGLFGAPTDRVWAGEELLYVDGAAIVDGYWSDFCRTYAARPARVAERAGYARARDAVRACDGLGVGGRAAGDVAAVLAEHLDIAPTDVGFGRFGHGIGLKVPEPPSLHPADPTPLSDGNVICVEPAVVHEGVNFVVEEEHVVVDGRLERLSCAAPEGILEL